MGNDDGRPMGKVTGSGLPARLWKEIMTAAHERLPVKRLPGSSAPEGFWGRLFGGGWAGDAGATGANYPQ
jgi:penicillin-binding protein 1A